MGTKQENAANRQVKVDEVEAQLAVWSARLDDLVVGCIEAGGQPNDAYRTRIDGMRTRLGVVQVKLGEFANPSSGGGAWKIFWASIADDWNAIKGGLADVKR